MSNCMHDSCTTCRYAALSSEDRSLLVRARNENRLSSCSQVGRSGQLTEIRSAIDWLSMRAVIGNLSAQSLTLPIPPDNCQEPG